MSETNRQDLPQGLWVVATPIGNLQDITLRAIRALEASDWIFCEDTRRTQVLLSALKISVRQKRLIRMDAHTTPKMAKGWLEKRDPETKCAWVTDAGTPSVSDPGSVLVRAALELGVRVVPVPGCSAVVALLSICGLSDAGFGFRGFFPRKSSERKKEVELAASQTLCSTWIWYESPQRILETLAEVSEVVPSAQMAVAKELTKVHEQVFYGTSTEVLQQIQSWLKQDPASHALGEWCFVIQFADPRGERDKMEALKSAPGSEEFDRRPDARLALRCLLEAGVTVSRASPLISQYFGISKKGTYKEALSLSEKKVGSGG